MMGTRAQNNKGYHDQLSNEKYEEIWEYYKQNTPLKKIAKLTGLHHSTVYKYINIGNPKKNIRPLKERKRQVNTHLEGYIVDRDARRRAEEYESIIKKKELCGKLDSSYISIVALYMRKFYANISKEKYPEGFNHNLYRTMLNNVLLGLQINREFDNIILELKSGDIDNTTLDKLRQITGISDIKDYLIKNLPRIIQEINDTEKELKIPDIENIKVDDIFKKMDENEKE